MWHVNRFISSSLLLVIAQNEHEPTSEGVLKDLIQLISSEEMSIKQIVNNVT